jgi:hypothetical protein
MGYNDGVFVTLQFSDTNGVPYSQGKLWHYATGGTTLKNIYSDAARTTPLAQPFVSDTSGRFNFYIDPDDDYHLLAKNNAETVTTFDEDPIRASHGNPHIGTEDHGTTAPASPTTDNLNHTFLQIDGDGELVDFLGCFDTDDPEYESIVQAVIAAQGIDDLVTKWPIADIRHSDYGADTSNADNRAEIQAAIDYCSAQGGGAVLVPPGDWKVKNLVGKSGVQLIGFGHTSKLFFPDAGVTTDDRIVKYDDQVDVDIQQVRFDGNGTNEATSVLVEVFNDTGTHSHAIFKALHFENQDAGIALKIHGASGNLLSTAIINEDCHFHGVTNAVYAQYVEDLKINGNHLSELSGYPITIEDSTNCKLGGNTISDWDIGEAGIHLIDTANTNISNNTVKATTGDEEACGIRTSGTSDNNIITENDVSGAFTSLDLDFVGANSIIHSNLGTTAFQNGAIITSGGADVRSYNYKLYDSQTTDSSGTGTGQLNDDQNTFNDVTSVDNPTTDSYDVARFPNLAKYKWVLFAVRSVISVSTADELQLGNSDVYDADIASPQAETYDIYPNVFDPGFFEVTPYDTVDIDQAGVGSNTGVLSDVISEKEFLKLVVKNRNTGAGINDNDIFLDDYQDIVTGDAFKIADAVNFDTLSPAEVICTTILWADTSMQDITIKLQNIGGGGTAQITAEVYRMKRAVDE